MPRHLFFTVGGTVQASGGAYIERAVDNELLEYCLAGEFAFVLTARQMGKSSLMVRTAERLSERGVRSVIIDLSQIGVQITEDAWYLGFMTVIEDALDLDTDVFEWWDEKQHLGYGQRLTLFFEEVVLKEVRDNIVMFVDEIDSTLSLPFTDDFFTTIRGVYNARSNRPELKRLTFVLIGVATPSDLVSDPSRTPFNIGREVEVSYFTAEEAAPLGEGFHSNEALSGKILGWVLSWTAGHPYLTQRLSSAIAQQDVESLTSQDVDRVVLETFFSEDGESDSNLRFVHDMLTQRAENATEVLTAYRDILNGKKVKDERHSHTLTHLKLSGVVGRENGLLHIKNRIYREVFDRKWLSRQWPEHWFKRIPVAVRGLVAASFVAIILLGLLAFQLQRNSRTESEAVLQAQILTQSQESQHQTAILNDSLQVALQEADRLRAVAEDANIQLGEQFRQVDALNRATQSTNEQLVVQSHVSDSLSAKTLEANQLLAIQSDVSDSLRSVAERLLGESVQARTETLIIALADGAKRQTRLGDPTLGALLARQAYQFSQSSGNIYEDPVYDALVEALNVLSPEGSQELGGPSVISSSGGAVRAADVNESGSMIVLANEDGSVNVYQVENEDFRFVSTIPASGGAVRGIRFLGDGSSVVMGTEDGSIRVADRREDGRYVVRRIARMNDSVWSIDVSSDESLVAVGDAGGNLIVIRLADETSVGQEAFEAPIRDISFGSNAELALALGSGELVIWSSLDGVTARWNAAQGRLHAVAFHPSGNYLVSGGDSTFVRQWTVQSAQHDESYRGHEGPVNDLAFSADGTRLASASSDHSIQIWKLDQENSDPIILQNHTSWVHSVAFSRNGSRVLSASNDRTAHLYNIDSSQLAARVCAATGGRKITSGEWDRFVGTDFDMETYASPCNASTASK